MCNTLSEALTLPDLVLSFQKNRPSLFMVPNQTLLTSIDLGELHINSCASEECTLCKRRPAMLPFESASEMLRTHDIMFGRAGRTCAEIVLDWAPRLFAVPIDPLTVRI